MLTNTNSKSVEASNALYSLMSQDYDMISERRHFYLEAVNRLVVKHAPLSVKNFLDIGAGNGNRTKAIQFEIGAERVEMVEPSVGMYSHQHLSQEFHCFHGVLDDYNPGRRYDLVTVLWNVLGHIIEREKRLKFLKRIHALLSDTGICVLDVNNRHNWRHYGLWNIAFNALKSVYKANPGLFELPYGHETFPVYIHSKSEMRSLFRSARMTVLKTYHVDYASGELKRFSGEGQLVFVLRRM